MNDFTVLIMMAVVAALLITLAWRVLLVLLGLALLALLVLGGLVVGQWWQQLSR